MLHLVTAVPGSGKTFWCINKMLQLAKDGESIYTNINGCTIPDVQPLPDDFDLSKLPDNSYVFVDEAQKIERYAAKGRQPLSDDPAIKFLEVHRHRGFEIYFITQDPEFLHKHILKLIGHHVALERPMGSRFPVVHEWSQYQSRTDTKAAKKKADISYNMALKKSVYQYYTSTVIDTHKFQWGKLGKILALPIAGIIFILSILFFTDNRFLHPKEEPEQLIQNTAQPATPAQQQFPPQQTQPQIPQGMSEHHYNESKRIAMVSKSDQYCRAYDGNGDIMRNLSYQDCIFYNDNPMALKSMDKGNEPQQTAVQGANAAISSVLPFPDLPKTS